VARLIQEARAIYESIFPTEIATPRYDAGRGLLLRGRGDGTLEPVPGQVSGILVYGDQRGAAFADYDGDGRTDLVVSQNGAATRLYHNEHARPGVRVRLVGGLLNPHAIGAVLRLVYEGSRGPAREVHGGSGYWSQDGPIQVLGLEQGKRATGVWVRWPGGSAAIPCRSACAATIVELPAVSTGRTVAPATPSATSSQLAGRCRNRAQARNSTARTRSSRHESIQPNQ